MWQEGLALLDEMIEPWTVVTYTTAIGIYDAANKWPGVLSLLHKMARRKLSSNGMTYAAAISALGRVGEVDLALWLLSSMPRMIRKDTILYNSAITACEKGQLWQKALMLFREMGQVRIAADTVSYSAAISACEKGANPLTALALFMRMDQCSIPKDQIVFNSTISACDKGMSWTMALQLLGQMQGARLKADACSYSAAITASGKASHWSTALKLLKEAKECGGHVSNMIVVNATISACEKGGQWQIALHMLAEHGERDTISFNSVMSACAVDTRWAEALAVFRSMGEECVEQTRRSYSALLDALRAQPAAASIFQQAKCKGFYSQLDNPRLLDLHGLSIGDVDAVVRWWLSDVARPDESGVVEIVTGWGRSRKVWHETDIRTYTGLLLEELRVPFELATNVGRIRVDARRIPSEKK